MKKTVLYAVLSAVILILLGFLLYSPAEKTAILDVRTPQEFSLSHAEGAINFELAKLQKGELPNIEKDTKITVYCRTGNRANQAKVLLEKNGYKYVENIGGLSNWQSRGGKVTDKT